MEEASKNITNPYDNYFFFENGASLLAELKATEALDLLVANIDVNDQYPSSLNDFPALVLFSRSKNRHSRNSRLCSVATPIQAGENLRLSPSLTLVVIRLRGL
jgi:hypothetical protein